ncbi:DUF2795 domain-containing protein [Streptomyces sp. SID9727]|uniref:DUF2795 domain-containing protein n=1 Tax=Streptomyces sp. SID9727 TaxID=2706114 RepID=UPI0013C67A33|nr:DUF2795 domain-containing protein [Streptomyces sp. SID9727]NEC63305.1 DUF2795 domain-containing protein [Streptomyces sp. SID9727]
MNANPIELQKALGGVNYPAGKGTIVDQARQNGAGDEIVAALDALPEKEYESPAQVSKEVAQES